MTLPITVSPPRPNGSASVNIKASACICAAVFTITCASPLEPDVFSHASAWSGIRWFSGAGVGFSGDVCASKSGRCHTGGLDCTSNGCPDSSRCSVWLSNLLCKSSESVKNTSAVRPQSKLSRARFGSSNTRPPECHTASTAQANSAASSNHNAAVCTFAVFRRPDSRKTARLKSARVQFGWVAIRSCWGREGNRIWVRCIAWMEVGIVA